ncbi:MAG: cobalt ECF transporter T component CbiQ [Coriobacteriales bacterium]|jgi:cobalt/nickel transport system permease protein|nr:cobalt ECF transporter T component CbiQ [Coriobacteriales bacterium]
MINALLSFAFIWCLTYGRLPVPVILVIGSGLAAFLFISSRHRHTGFIVTDVLAQASRLKSVNPTLKVITAFALIIVGIASPSAWTGVFLALTAFLIATFGGNISPHEYVEVLSIPLAFLLIGGLALLIEATPDPTGIVNINLYYFYLTVSPLAQQKTALVISRAMGAFSCLSLLSVTTPMSDIIGVLRRMHCPELIIDLMYLIYRYIFILLTMHHEMMNAAKSRLGLRNYRTSLRTTASVYSNLLARSHNLASQNFDAMESRCYNSGISFLENRVKANAVQVSACIVLLTAASAISLITVMM